MSKVKNRKRRSKKSHERRKKENRNGNRVGGERKMGENAVRGGKRGKKELDNRVYGRNWRIYSRRKRSKSKNKE